MILSATPPTSNVLELHGPFQSSRLLDAVVLERDAIDPLRSRCALSFRFAFTVLWRNFAPSGDWCESNAQSRSWIPKLRSPPGNQGNPGQTGLNPKIETRKIGTHLIKWKGVPYEAVCFQLGVQGGSRIHL